MAHTKKYTARRRVRITQPSSFPAHGDEGEAERPSPKRQHIVELLIAGSNADNGSQCGLAYVNSNNAFSNSNANIGARLKLYT